MAGMDLNATNLNPRLHSLFARIPVVAHVAEHSSQHVCYNGIACFQHSNETSEWQDSLRPADLRISATVGTELMLRHSMTPSSWYKRKSLTRSLFALSKGESSVALC